MTDRREMRRVDGVKAGLWVVYVLDEAILTSISVPRVTAFRSGTITFTRVFGLHGDLVVVLRWVNKRLL
jgi:hypothetical protein